MDESYIKQLLEDLEIYTTYPKPRGKGGVQNVKRMSEEFRQCFGKLTKMNKLDIVLTIMSKFADVKDVMKPIRFETWIMIMIDQLSENDCLKLYQMNNGFFEKWIDENADNRGIKEFAKKIGVICSKTEFLDFIRFVTEHHGKVPGIYSCFPSNRENIQKQILINGKNAVVFFEFIDIDYNQPYIAEAEVHLKINPLNSDVKYLKILDCIVNEIPVSEYSFLDFETSVPICYSNENIEFEEYKVGYIKISKILSSGGILDIQDIEPEISDPINDDTLDTYVKLTLGLKDGDWIPITNSNPDMNQISFTIYTNFFEDNEIDEISSLKLSIALLDENECIMEESEIVMIELDYFTGDYVVKR